MTTVNFVSFVTLDKFRVYFLLSRASVRTTVLDDTILIGGHCVASVRTTEIETRHSMTTPLQVL